MNKYVIYILFCAINVCANTFYVDPINGTINGTGSINNPFPSIQFIVQNNLIQSNEPASKPYKWNDPLKLKNANGLIKSGDTIKCFSGYQGALIIFEYYNNDYITIMPIEGHRVMFRNIHIRASSHWRISGVEVSPSFHPVFHQITNIVNLESHNFAGPVSDVEIRDCKIFTVENAYDWTADDWLKNVGSGISAAYYSRRFKIINNEILNVDFGISLAVDNALVQGNRVTNFSGDALRGNGSFMTFDQNIIMNNYNVDDNHDDAFQGFNFGLKDTFRNVRLTRNLVIQNADPKQPLALRGSLQGLAFFDGNIKNWFVANNIVVVDHYHGISLYGCHECQVVNNTVVDQVPGNKPKPWILVRSKKSGEPIQNNIIVNNISTNVFLEDDVNPLIRQNLIIDGSVYDEHFIDPMAFDYHLIPQSRAIDNALWEFAPEKDFFGNSRPFGLGADIGAIECIEACIPTDINELNSMDFKLFPNPSHSNISVRHKAINSDLLILDFYGHVILSKSKIEQNEMIDISNLKRGIYIVKIVTDQSSRSAPLIKL